MIDGLTRRVQQLLDELDVKDRIHFEEMTELKNEKVGTYVKLRYCMAH